MSSHHCTNGGGSMRIIVVCRSLRLPPLCVRWAVAKKRVRRRAIVGQSGNGMVPWVGIGVVRIGVIQPKRVVVLMVDCGKRFSSDNPYRNRSPNFTHVAAIQLEIGRGSQEVGVLKSVWQCGTG